MNALRGTLARRRTTLLALFATGACALATPAARAAESRVVGTQPGPAAETQALRLEAGQVKLTLDEAIELALQRNLGLAVQRYTRAQARLGIQQALGIYDFGLGASATRSHSESPLASSLEGVAVQTSDRTSATLGLSRLLPTGGTAQLGLQGSKFDTNALSFGLNPSFGAGVSFSFAQPLLKSFGRGQTEFGIQVARLSSDESKEAFTAEVVATIQQVENAYWGLVEAREQLKVAEESRRIAEQLHKDNKVRVDVGTLAPLELVSSEAGIATREEEVIRARAAIGNSEDVLKTLLHFDGAEAWAATILPETEPTIESPDVKLDEALSTALASRPELAREKLTQQSREIEAAYYAQQTRPRLDLTLSYGYSGIGGDLILDRDANGNPTSILPGGINDAFDQVTGADFPAWSVGLEFGYPLGNRTAKARSAIARLAEEQGKVGLSALEQQVTTEVRLAVRGLDTARQELESAKVSVRLQNANLDAEKKKFLNGLSTSFQILQVEDQLTAARSREVQAVTGYRRALVEYQRSIGRLLDSTQVTISD
jgi:outer membrane protein TolC